MLTKTIRRIRRNHGLEHATIHMLSARYSGFSAQGNANHRGFYLNIYGDLPESAIVAAVDEAYRRMKAGEHELAVHPNCGTALLTTATLSTLAAQSALSLEQARQGSRQRDWQVLVGGLPGAILAAALALVVSRPLGLHLQRRYTTDGDLGDLRVVRVRRLPPTPATRFFQLLLAQGRPLAANAYFVETAG